MKGQVKRIKTEYKILMVVIFLSVTVLIGLYLYKKYFSPQLDADDYQNCTIEEHEWYQIKTCRIEHDNQDLISFSFPILKEENCSYCHGVNLETERTFQEEWNQIRLVRIENEGLQVRYDQKTEYLIGKRQGIFTLLKRTYSFYPNKHVVGVRDYVILDSREQGMRNDLLEALQYDVELTNQLIQETIRRIYFVDYRYDYLTEQDPYDSVQALLLHATISNLDALYLDEQGNLMGLIQIANPRVMGNTKTYYITLKQEETRGYYSFQAEE